MGFTEVLRSTDGGPAFAERRVIVDQSEWCRFWSVLRPTEECDTALVDFSQEAAVVVALGTGLTSAYSVEITCIEGDEESDAIHVLFTESVPGAGCLIPQVLTSPFNVVKIHLPVGPATFEESIAVNDCE